MAREAQRFANPVVTRAEVHPLRTAAARVMADDTQCAECGKQLHGYGASLLTIPDRWWCLSCMIELCKAWEQQS